MNPESSVLCILSIVSIVSAASIDLIDLLTRVSTPDIAVLTLEETSLAETLR